MSAPPPARPFVKWAGGKGALVEEILARAPHLSEVERYLEPFLGAGAVLFAIRSRAPSLPCLASDTNPELVNAYAALRDELGEVLAHLERHEAAHDRAHYYAVRASVPRGVAERAARFIYLNRTCFNGLYRVNSKGEFNVPMGRYTNPRILDRENLEAVSSVLRSVEVRAADFAELLSEARAGDLVYLDPPYQPLSRTSSFTAYTKDGFGELEQERLARLFAAAVDKGATVILSNSGDARVRELYENLNPAPRIDEVQVKRAINSKTSRRGPVGELLVHYQRPGP